MSEGHTIHLNNRTHTLKFRSKDVIAAQGVMPGGKSLLQALAVDRDMAAVCVGAAFAMRHEYENKKDNKAPGPSTIGDWIDREPAKYRELEQAVLRAAEDHYVATDRIRRGDLTGEAPAAPPTQAPPGSSSIGSQDGGISPLSSSPD